MKKFIFLIIIFSLVFYYGFRYFNNNGFLGQFNNKLNTFIKNRPKIACVEDNDCHLTTADCNPCSCGLAANKAWQPYCPFIKSKNIICSPCEQFPILENIKCVNTECQIVY
jgi:hypothetical protein